MKYNEEEAQAIIKTFGLSDKTKKVWKTRGSIPDKYTKDEYKPRTKSKAGDIKHERFIHLLDSKTINKQVLAALTGVEAHKLQDAQQNKTRLSDSDLQKCVVEIKRLKVSIAKAFENYSQRALKAIYTNNLIVYTRVVKDRQIIDRISYVRNKKQDVDRSLYEATKDKYILFALTLSI